MSWGHLSRGLSGLQSQQETLLNPDTPSRKLHLPSSSFPQANLNKDNKEQRKPQSFLRTSPQEVAPTPPATSHLCPVVKAAPSSIPSLIHSDIFLKVSVRQLFQETCRPVAENQEKGEA